MWVWVEMFGCVYEYGGGVGVGMEVCVCMYMAGCGLVWVDVGVASRYG